jgi:hypothetical protein
MSNIDRTLYLKKAQSMWDAMTNSERTGIRFGMFPVLHLQAAKDEGYDGEYLTSALIEVAKTNGGMVS